MTNELSGEKCDEMGMGAPTPYRPGGGATSFSSLFAFRDAQLNESAYYMATGDYRDLSNNILNDPEMTAAEKADALVALTAEFQAVVQNAPELYAMKEETTPEGEKVQKPGILRGALTAVKNLIVGGDKAVWTTAYINDLPDSAFLYIEPGGTKTNGKTDGAHRHWPYKDANGSVDMAHLRNALARIPQTNVPQAAKDAATKRAEGILNNTKEIESVEEMLADTDAQSGFKVIDSPDGPRWLAFSSNAFEDKEKELFSTKAHEDAIAWADAHNEHGPLRIFHVDGADVGDTDFQALAGRFLIESGTFRNDEYGQAAVKYFKDHPDEQFQVSIGYWYKEGDDADGTYDWLRYRERSICPAGRAANPFTMFALSEQGKGEETMNAEKQKMLADIFGPDLAAKIEAKAEKDTKALEALGVRFKEDPAPATKGMKEEMTALMADMPEETRAKMMAVMDKYSPGKKDDEPAAAVADPPAPDASKTEEPDPMVAAVLALTEQFAPIKDAVEALQGEVKELKESGQNLPRGAQTFQRAGSQGITLDPEKIKALTGQKEDEPVDPVMPYISDLVAMHGGGR